MPKASFLSGPKQIEDHYACVTGADRGLGLALVKTLLQDGHIVFAGRFLEEPGVLDSLAAEHRGRLHVVRLDVANKESVASALASIQARTDRLDLLINNAAILGDIVRRLGEELDYDEMLRVYNVNTLGPLRVTNTFLPLLLQGETKLIVNISSEAGSIGACHRKSWFAYAMSKAALNMQSAILQNAVRGQGVQVLVLHPGWIKTYMRGELDAAAELLPEEAAVRVMSIIARHGQYLSDKPAYLDDQGRRLPW